MHAQHQSNSEPKATTTSGRLLAIAMIGTAVIAYQVHKTTDARAHLESLASQAYDQGELSDVDAAVIARLLASPASPRPISLLSIA